MVCKTDLATPTREAVIAEQTEAHRNWEKVKIQPEMTKVTNTGKNPSSVIKRLNFRVVYDNTK